MGRLGGWLAAGMAVVVLCGCVTPTVTKNAQAPSPEGAHMNLRSMGSFHVGGREVAISGKPVKEVLLTPGGVPVKLDPNGIYDVEQMYVQYFLPAERRGGWPMLMWHGGGLTGVTYETTPDGRPGWLHAFVQRGWDVYNSDAMERGRSGWAPLPEVFKGDPVLQTKPSAFERFRIGAGEGSYNDDLSRARVLPGNQFPVASYDNFVKQQVPRWTTTDEAILRAYVAEIDRVCPCVIVFHSQAGQFGFRAAQARPDKVKALVAIEPSGFGEDSRMDAYRNIPVLAIYGDYIEQDARWPTIRRNGHRFYEKIRAAGGQVEEVDLPTRGIHGNSHMLMMDRNNADVAALIQQWLERQELYH